MAIRLRASTSSCPALTWVENSAYDLSKSGFDTAAIMPAGGWKSINVLTRYLEKTELNVRA